MILIFLEYLLLLVLLLVLVFTLTDRVLRAKAYRGPVSDHFNGRIFLNLKEKLDEQESHSFWSILRWMISRKNNVWEKRTVEQTKPAAQVLGGELIATLINHATVLIQTEGLNIITDPIYSKRASPFSFIGPHRFTEPGVAFEDLPKIDAILISHNHYDHLDIATLQRLATRDAPTVIAPLGNKGFLEKHGITNSVELDWWQSHTLANDVSIQCVPAQHFSARALSDRNKTLWSGHVIQTPHGDIYFAGDTGFGPFVHEIATRFPSGFRLGLLPIGAFRPQWFMKEVHISPDEAFLIQEELKIQDVLAVHFGTFKLADDKQDEPVERAHELAQNIPPTKRFLALTNGSSVVVR